MSAALDEKTILVVCDNHMLSKALQLNLEDYWGVSQLAPQSSRQPTTQAERFNLIILALSSPASEPVVALTRAALVQYIGRIPLLIISDRPFRPSPEERITHLDFPFSPEALHNTVQAILHEES